MRRLLVITDGFVQDLEIGQELTIGRAYTNLLRLEGEEVSRVHAILYRREKDYIVRDLDSKNGVFVNAQRITSSLVVPGDEIQIGNYILIFDPPPDFDVAGFMKQRSLNPPAEPQEKPRASSSRHDKQAAADDTDERFETSIHFAPESQPQVFYDLQEIDDLSQTDVLPQSSLLTTELLRALRCLGPDNGEDKPEPNLLYQKVLQAAICATRADRGVVVLKDAQNDNLQLGAIYPEDRDVSVSRVVLRAVLREHRAVLCNNAQKDPRFQHTETIQRENISSLLGFPLMLREQPIGLIYLDTQGRPDMFRREHLIIINYLSKFTVLAMQHAELLRQP